jgi:hypothetical protein
VDACTVAALDAITAFAVPNPSCSSQGSWLFRVWWLSKSPCRVDHPAYFGVVNITWTNPFQPSTLATLGAPDPNSCDGDHKSSEELWIFSVVHGDSVRHSERTGAAFWQRQECRAWPGSCPLGLQRLSADFRMNSRPGIFVVQNGGRIR